MRTIKSFVIRQGRMTPAQKQAFENLNPLYFIDISNPEHANLFKNHQNIVLEIGFGMGDALLHYAKSNPDTLYLGIEVHPPGIGRVLRFVETLQLQNIRIIQGDAIEALQNFIPDESLAAVHLFFPDPWPKARHHKRRIVNIAFADLIAKKLKAQGKFHLATDWENYAEWMNEVLNPHPAFKKISEDRGNRPLTKFEQRGIHLGHSIFDLYFEKKEK